MTSAEVQEITTTFSDGMYITDIHKISKRNMLACVVIWYQSCQLCSLHFIAGTLQHKLPLIHCL